MGKVARVDEDGRLTLAKELTEHLGLECGGMVEIERSEDGGLVVRRREDRPVSELFGMLHRLGRRAVTIDEMNEAIARGWTGET